ncbi:golgin subfamily A member 6-like protein 22 [Rhopilema esculentum]|uniref:golgin subfamily A member 6-like protein 22 n=1 Tax=Rhopilema esculentum TaxID=499914 RepID=UPI0031D32513|eukprot:gene2289-17903_t
MSSSRTQRTRKRNRDTVFLLQGEVHSAKKELSSLTEQNDRLLGENEQLRKLNLDLAGQLKFEKKQQCSPDCAFQAFINRISAEKYQDLVRLAFLRKVTKYTQQQDVKNKLIEVLTSPRRNSVCLALTHHPSEFASSENVLVDKDSGIVDEKSELSLQNESNTPTATCEAFQLQIGSLKEELASAALKYDEISRKLNAALAQLAASENQAKELADQLKKEREKSSTIANNLQVKEDAIERIREEYEQKISKMVMDRQEEKKQDEMGRLAMEEEKDSGKAELEKANIKIQDSEVNSIAAHLAHTAILESLQEESEECQKASHLQIATLEEKWAKAEITYKEERKRNEMLEIELAVKTDEIRILKKKNLQEKKDKTHLWKAFVGLAEDRADAEEQICKERRETAKKNASFADRIHRLEADYGKLDRVNKILANKVVDKGERCRVKEEENQRLHKYLNSLEERIDSKELLVQHLLRKQRRGVWKKLFCCS